VRRLRSLPDIYRLCGFVWLGKVAIKLRKHEAKALLMQSLYLPRASEIIKMMIPRVKNWRLPSLRMPDPKLQSLDIALDHL
jgi:hypothetical protein